MLLCNFWWLCLKYSNSYCGTWCLGAFVLLTPSPFHSNTACLHYISHSIIWWYWQRTSPVKNVTSVTWKERMRHCIHAVLLILRVFHKYLIQSKYFEEMSFSTTLYRLHPIPDSRAWTPSTIVEQYCYSNLSSALLGERCFPNVSFLSGNLRSEMFSTTLNLLVSHVVVSIVSWESV